MSAPLSSITTLSGLTWEYPSTPSPCSPSSTAPPRHAPLTWVRSWCTAGTTCTQEHLALMSVPREYRRCCSRGHIAPCFAPQRRGGSHGDLHRHRQHAATDQGQRLSQHPGFPQAYSHSAQLPGSDRGKRAISFPRLSFTSRVYCLHSSPSSVLPL